MVLEKDGEEHLDRSVRNKVLQRVKGKTDILCAIKKRKPNWTGHILRMNCLIKHVTEGKIEEKTEETGRR
jgi:hypothetical protein